MRAIPVKGKTEAGRRREERALETRRRIVEAAHALFLDLGYVATTVEAVAHQAAVAPATVYQAFGSKPAVLAAVLDAAIAGDTEPLALLDRAWVKALRREPDPERRLTLVVRKTTEIAARTAPIKRVMRDAAATDMAARDLIAQDHERRYRTQEALVELIVGTRPRRSRRAACSDADSFFALVNSDTYDLLVGHLGWTLAEWRTWLTRLLRSELLSEG
jgi:AcrR family transcriptional regulator